MLDFRAKAAAGAIHPQDGQCLLPFHDRPLDGAWTVGLLWRSYHSNASHVRCWRFYDQGCL